MKYVFLICFGLLTAVSLAEYLNTEKELGGAPVLYWVTDANPARAEQVRLFHEWLARNGHADIDLKLDTANGDPAKKIIQGVSGVAGDVMDMYTEDMPYFVSTGLLADLTDSARKLGYGPDHTFSAARSLVEQDGRQYRFPCNVITALYWINRDTFSECHQPVPPSQWSLDTFEKLGVAFVTAANPRGRRQTKFYVDSVEPVVLRRSLGLDMFNETMTRCTFDDPRYAESLQLMYKWTYIQHIVPSAAEADSFATQAGYGGAGLQLFCSGNYAMFRSGLNALLQLRTIGNMNLTVTEAPNGGFRNGSLAVRAAGVYAGSKHKTEAELFMSFLASKSYNEQVVADADALPPNPAYVHGSAFDRPAARQNEWECHKPFVDEAEQIAIAPSFSPFILPSVAERLEQDAFDGFFRSGRLTASAAGQQAARTINAEIVRNLTEQPRLQGRFEEATQRQRQIESLRAAGKTVPLRLIDNPFHRAYYIAKGWASN